MSPEILLRDPLIIFFKEKAKKLGMDIFVVGGIPRDLVMGKEVFNDYDFVVFSDPLRIAKEFKKNFNSKIAYYSDFKTVEIVFENKSIDIAMARKEYYPYPGSLPKVEMTFDINEDLARRDFTINSIAIKIFPEFGNIYDPFDGIKDIIEKRVRVLKKGSFYEDPTRAFRGIRYKNRFNFSYTDETLEEFYNYTKSVKNLKFPRIKKELELISIEAKRVKMWKEIAEMNLLYFFDENLKLKEDLIEKLSEVLPFEPSSWICFFYLFLKNNEITPFFNHLSNKERKIIEEIKRGEKILNKERGLLELHHFFKKFEEMSLKFLGIKDRKVLDYIEKRKNIKKILRGDEIFELGFEKKFIERIKEILEVKQMEGEIKTKEDAIKYLKERKDEIQGSFI